ncbi:hypothetical protein VPNG_09585 [Cytospora leucostoma]|uniref:Adenosine deaminase domain-containing protein n=1 Tax=Cytospora leucostoma TaxID=1230097 RepID=A0A423VN36_9PEZI|nr:hypothetical protein VPNG_09585 [Cytospora leucostoma]
MDGLTVSPFIASLPKVELHVHIEGTLQPSLRWKLAHRNNIQLPYPTYESLLDSYKIKFNHRPELNGRQPGVPTFLEAYFAGCEVLRTEDDFYELAMEYLARCGDINVRYCEPFFDIQAHTRRGVPHEAVLNGYLRARADGAERYGVSSNWIFCFIRDEPVGDGLAAYEASRPWAAGSVPGGKGLFHAVGLASNAYDRPPMLFEEGFRRAKADGLHVTTHCDFGQKDTHAHIREAIFSVCGGKGVERIDHGLDAEDDPELIQGLKDRGISLTLCPHAYHRRTATDVLFPKIRRLLDAGVRFCINSDDPVYMHDVWIDGNMEKGTAYASLEVDRETNLTEILNDSSSEVLPEVKNITTEVWDQLEDWADYVYTNLTQTVEGEIKAFFEDGDPDDFDICWDCYAFPSLNVDFEVNLTDIPDATLKLEFDELELYMLLDISLEADKTYTIDLYPKSWYQPAGIKVGNELVGFIISLQLILALDAEVDISTGVHIAFDDGLAMEIAMFGSEVSTLLLTDGHFEFLPVTVNTTGVTLDATLRLGVTAGLNMSKDLGHNVKLGAGASAVVYADLAHFHTNITLPESTELTSRDDGDDCLMPIIESYEIGVGAQAGAFVQFDNASWGPTPDTSIQIFYTTLFSACAVMPASATATPTTSAAIAARETAPALLAERDDENLTTTAVSTTFTVTNVLCMSAGLRNCPASLQTTVQATSTSTTIVTVSDGQKATFPATTSAGSPSTVAFGKGVQKVKASSGSPVSYVPPTTASSSSSGSSSSTGGVVDNAKDDYNGLSEKNKKLVIGLCAGLGGALLVATAAGIWFCCKKRGARKQKTRGFSPDMGEVHAHETSQPFLGGLEPNAKWKQTNVDITEAGPPTPPVPRE